MSSAEQSSINQETIEQTKQQIRGLVGEIVQLSKSDLGPEEYYPAVLQRIVQALAAVGGAVWVADESRHLRLIYQQSLSDTLLDVNSEDAQKHIRLLEYVAQSRQPQLVPPMSGLSDDRAGGNPTRHLLVLAPMQNDSDVEGIIEIFQRPDSQPATQRGYLKFVLQMCEQIAEWLKTRKLRHFSDRHSLWANADQFSRLVHDSLDLRETAYTVVNEGRRLIGCDRVSLALMRGQKCVVEAISGQDSIDQRSNIVTALSTLSSRVVAAAEPLYYNGNTADLPPQLEEAVHGYVDESYAKAVAVLPLRKPGDLPKIADEHAARDQRSSREIIGALVIEQIDNDLPREVLAPKIDLVYEHAARALSNSMDYNNLFLMPVWRALGKASWVVKSRTLPKTLTIAGSVLAVIIALCIVPYRFDLTARGSLQPVNRRDIFVPTTGRVVDVHVTDGKEVKEGDLLLEMANEDLEGEFKKLLGQIAEAQDQKRAVDHARLQASLTAADKSRFDGDSKRLASRLANLTQQLELLHKKRDGLKIRSPINGRVVLSWEVEKSLRGRPVETGALLMSVADTSGEWELELLMPERRIGHVHNAQDRLQEDLTVRYILATDPGTPRFGSVRDIHDTTEMHDQEGHAVRVRVQLDQKDIPSDPRPGASATAEVRCGWRPIGYVYLHEFMEWVQSKVFFTFF